MEIQLLYVTIAKFIQVHVISECLSVHISIIHCSSFRKLASVFKISRTQGHLFCSRFLYTVETNVGGIQQRKVNFLNVLTVI